MDLTLTDVSKRYGENTVLSHFSCTFRKGGHYAIMAPSGRGKTTLLRLILGLEMPDSGTITGVPKKFSAVFQENRLFPNLTLGGNLRMALGRAVSDSKILSLLAELGLEGWENTPVCQLSGGMARRVALARGILADPELLVLDEPFTGLDSETADRCAAALVSHCPDATIVLVTHQEADAQRIFAEQILLPQKQ